MEVVSDMEYVQEQFTAGDERGGNGLYRWLEKSYDVKSPKMQIALRAQFDASKLPITSSVHHFTKTWIDALSIWSKITGNDKRNVEILANFYEKMRDKMPGTPSENPMVRVRAKLADLFF